MRQLTIKVVFVLFFIFSVKIIFCNNAVVGSKLFNLKSSARVNALGGCFTALNNDINAIEENPAGTTFANTLAFHVNFSKWISDINYFNLKTIIPTKLKNGLPLNFLITSTYVLYPSVTHYDETGVNIGSVNMSEGFTGLGVSSILFEKLQAGLLLKYSYRSIYN